MFSSNHGILSDRQITELCVPPTHRLDEALFRSKLQDVTDQRSVAEIHRDSMVPLTEEEREALAFTPMISPFSPTLKREVPNIYEKLVGNALVHVPGPPRKIISRGLSSFGYDITLSEEFQIFTNLNAIVIDPKRFDAQCLRQGEVRTDEDGGRYVILPPNGYLLGKTVEYFHLPRDITALFIGKSTYARAGVTINITPGEAGWRGNLVVEVGNLTNLPVKIYANEGIAQMLIFRGSEECQTSYADRGGKYQDQRNLQLPLV